jgi:hypothetical protein
MRQWKMAGSVDENDNAIIAAEHHFGSLGWMIYISINVHQHACYLWWEKTLENCSGEVKFLIELRWTFWWIGGEIYGNASDGSSSSFSSLLIYILSQLNHFLLPTIPINLTENHPQTTHPKNPQNFISARTQSQKRSINDSWKRISFAFKWSISRQYKILINCGSYFPSVCHKISLLICMNITKAVANDT